MFLLKKVFLWGLFAGLMLFGISGTQSDSSALQGMGLFGVVAAFVVLYIIYKVMWTFLSFGLVFLVIGGVVFFILYSMGVVGSPGAIGESIRSLTNISSSNTEETQYASEGENTSEYGNLFAKKKTADLVDNAEFNPYDYPSVTDHASVVTGSILRIKALYIRLFGIDAPDADQSCADKRGRGYNCGQKAITWLQDFIAGRKVTCHILGDIKNNRATGACFVGENDLSAAVAKAGWAVAYTKNTDIYVPYENKARSEKKGLWSGRFYLPQDWRKLKSRTYKVEIEKSGGADDWFDGWF